MRVPISQRAFCIHSSIFAPQRVQLPCDDFAGQIAAKGQPCAARSVFGLRWWIREMVTNSGSEDSGQRWIYKGRRSNTTQHSQEMQYGTSLDQLIVFEHKAFSISCFEVRWAKANLNGDWQNAFAPFFVVGWTLPIHGSLPFFAVLAAIRKKEQRQEY